MARRKPANLAGTSFGLTIAGFTVLGLAMILQSKLDLSTANGRVLCLIPAFAAVGLLIAAMAVLWQAYRAARDDASPPQ